MGAQSADSAVVTAGMCRDLWPDSKIVLLFEYISPGDFQKLLASPVDGCVPLFAPQDTLISTLRLVMNTNIRVMFVPDAGLLPRQSAPIGEPYSGGIEREPLPIGMAAGSYPR